jgi:hypothetical protein
MVLSEADEKVDAESEVTVGKLPYKSPHAGGVVSSHYGAAKIDLNSGNALMWSVTSSTVGLDTAT